MYLKPIKIFRLDGNVIRPKTRQVIEVTEKEAFTIKKQRHAISLRNPNIVEGLTVVIKSKAILEQEKNIKTVTSKAKGSKKQRAPK